MLPTFICIGPGRTGTTWLYEVLSEHPEVRLAAGIKETEFFDLNYEKGIDWYTRFFIGGETARAVGEITNRYIFDPSVPARIKREIPECKIIIGLRNPYDRIQSNYSFKLREGTFVGSFEEALRDMPQIVSENQYCSLIRPYIETFGKSKVFFMIFDDIENAPEQLCQTLFEFLGVATDFVPGVARKKINQAVLPKHRWIAPLTKKTARLLRAAGLYRVLTMAKRSSLIKRVLFKPYDYQRDGLLTPEVRGLIAPVFEPEISTLQEITGRNLRHWRQEDLL